MGFTFDDTDTTGVATLIAEMRRLIEKDPHNSQRIFPFIGWEEVANSPTHTHHRYVINFEDFPLRRDDLDADWASADAERRQNWLRAGIVPLDYPEPVASDWPDLLALVHERAKPERDRQTRKALRERWWQYAEKRPGLYRAIVPIDRVLVAGSQASSHYALAFLPKGIVYSSNLSVIAIDTYAGFANLQSRVHEEWARFFMSTLEDRLAYTPTSCFEPFPFSAGFQTDARLEEAGREYYEFRAGLMVDNDEGLTKTYNRFHDPDERSNAIGELRRLHDAMDRAVLDAYGWSDLRPTCDFELEWEDDDEDEDEANGRARRRKKPWRYRWPEEVRDDVLARLLALNKERAEQERLELGDLRRRRA